MQTSQNSSTRAGAPSPRDVKAGQLKEEFRDRGRTGSDGSLLLWSTDAVDLVNRAADEGVPILAISLIAPAGKAADAAVDHRADYTHEVSDGHGCWEAADAFIRRRGELGLLFDVELGDDPLEIV
jgi:hypothetical protein